MYGKCGHLCSLVPRFLDMVICDFCTRDAIENDPEAEEVWVEIRKKESPVLRKLPKPRVNKYAPGQTIPLFEAEDIAANTGTDDNPVPY